MSLVAVRVKEEPEGAGTDQMRVKDEAGRGVGTEGAAQDEAGRGGGTVGARCVAQESAELGHYLPFDRIDTVCECVKTEPSCSASEWADLYAEHAVKAELVLGPECVQRPRARAAPAECFYPSSESSAESVRALAVGAEPKECSVRLERVPHRGAPPARARGSGRDTLAPADGDSDIEDDIYTTIDYDKDPICDLCGRRFALKSDLMRHVVVHIHTPAGTEQDERGDGDQEGDLPRFLWRWARLVPRECRVRLERCDAPRGAAMRPPSAGRETFQHDATNTYVCDICKRRFTLKRYLILHNKVHSPNISQLIHKRSHRTNAPHACECKEEFSILSDLLTHIRSHTGGTPFSCEICNRQFTEFSSLKRHKSIVHEGTYEYTHNLLKGIHFCEICNKGCASLTALHIHKRVHTGEKPYFCGVCKQGFTQSCDLIAHRRIHTGEKPYSCKICEKRFRKLTDLYRHKRLHTGEKPHCCKQCGKKFRRLYLLTEHTRKHTGEKPFCCEICAELFYCYDALRGHKGIHKKKANRKRGRPRKRRTPSFASCVRDRDDMDRKDSNDGKTRDRDVLKKETDCADHTQVGGEVDDETNPRDVNGTELDQSDCKVTMCSP